MGNKVEEIMDSLLDTALYCLDKSKNTHDESRNDDYINRTFVCVEMYIKLKFAEAGYDVVLDSSVE